jgi:hypothetical protein
LRTYPGSLVLVTHDRYVYFLHRRDIADRAQAFHRWFNRVVIEGERASARAEDQEDASSGSEDSDDAASCTGMTYRVGAGKVKAMPRGMEQYVALVEKKLKKQGVIA